MISMSLGYDCFCGPHFQQRFRTGAWMIWMCTYRVITYNCMHLIPPLMCIITTMEKCGVDLQWLYNLFRLISAWLLPIQRYSSSTPPQTTRRSSRFVGHSYSPALPLALSVGKHRKDTIMVMSDQNLTVILCAQKLISIHGSACFMNRGVSPTSCYKQSSVGSSIGKLLSHCCRSREW